jgi:hypothetical protein
MPAPASGASTVLAAIIALADDGAAVLAAQ